MSSSCPAEGGHWALWGRRDVHWGVEGGWDQWGELWAWGEIDCLPFGDNLIYIQRLSQFNFIKKDCNSRRDSLVN